MPNITIAKNAGFCPGVKRAIDQVLELSKKTGKKIGMVRYKINPAYHAYLEIGKEAGLLVSD